MRFPKYFTSPAQRAGSARRRRGEHILALGCVGCALLYHTAGQESSPFPQLLRKWLEVGPLTQIALTGFSGVAQRESQFQGTPI